MKPLEVPFLLKNMIMFMFSGGVTPIFILAPTSGQCMIVVLILCLILRKLTVLLSSKYLFIQYHKLQMFLNMDVYRLFLLSSSL